MVTGRGLVGDVASASLFSYLFAVSLHICLTTFLSSFPVTGAVSFFPFMSGVSVRFRGLVCIAFSILSLLVITFRCGFFFLSFFLSRFHPAFGTALFSSFSFTSPGHGEGGFRFLIILFFLLL